VSFRVTSNTEMVSLPAFVGDEILVVAGEGETVLTAEGSGGRAGARTTVSTSQEGTRERDGSITRSHVAED